MKHSQFGLVSAADIGRACNVTPRAAQHWSQAPDFPTGLEIGPARLYVTSEVADWLEAHDKPPMMEVDDA